MKRLAPVRLCESGLPSCGALRSGAAQKVLQRRERAFMQSPESIAEILALKANMYEKIFQIWKDKGKKKDMLNKGYAYMCMCVCVGLCVYTFINYI